MSQVNGPQQLTPARTPDAFSEGGLRAPPHYGPLLKLWWWFDLLILVKLARPRLPNFVRQVYHLPHRVLDLLEIAAYVFAADRSVIRGRKDAESN